MVYKVEFYIKGTELFHCISDENLKAVLTELYNLFGTDFDYLSFSIKILKSFTVNYELQSYYGVTEYGKNNSIRKFFKKKTERVLSYENKNCLFGLIYEDEDYLSYGEINNKTIITKDGILSMYNFSNDQDMNSQEIDDGTIIVEKRNNKKLLENIKELYKLNEKCCFITNSILSVNAIHLNGDDNNDIDNPKNGLLLSIDWLYLLNNGYWIPIKDSENKVYRVKLGLEMGLDNRYKEFNEKEIGPIDKKSLVFQNIDDVKLANLQNKFIKKINKQISQ